MGKIKDGVKNTAGGCAHFMYNKQDGFMGRHTRSWLEILAFYFFYYSCIAVFYAGTVAVFYAVMDSDHPLAQEDQSLLGQQPGMGFAPQVHDPSTSSLIYLNGDPIQRDMNVQKIMKILNNYQMTKKQNDENPPGAKGVDKARDVDVITYLDGMDDQQCNVKNQFGYAQGEPCVMLWLNKVYNFKPEPLSQTEVIKNEYLNEETKWEANLLFVFCEGASPGDHENIEKMTYFPKQGFDLSDDGGAKFYPYKKQPGYQNPFLFIKFKVRRFVPVTVICRPLAKNIESIPTWTGKYVGSVRFELLVDIRGEGGVQQNNNNGVQGNPDTGGNTNGTKTAGVDKAAAVDGAAGAGATPAAATTAAAVVNPDAAGGNGTGNETADATASAETTAATTVTP